MHQPTGHLPEPGTGNTPTLPQEEHGHFVVGWPCPSVLSLAQSDKVLPNTLAMPRAPADITATDRNVKLLNPASSVQHCRLDSFLLVWEQLARATRALLTRVLGDLASGA